MLLRRIKTHIQNENWFAVFVDFVIVVVGVFIGIQVANWNDSLADQQRETEYLARLENDFKDIENRLVSNVTDFDKAVDAILYVQRTLKESKELSKEEGIRYREELNLIDTSSVPAWQSGTYVEMQSAGELRLIQDKALKTVLTAYDQGAQIAHKGWNVLINSQVLTMSTIVKRHIEYSPNNDTTSTHGKYGFYVSDFNYQNMLIDKEFKVALSGLLRVQTNNRALQSNQLVLAKDVLALLNIKSAP
jgi:hypothetical protein